MHKHHPPHKFFTPSRVKKSIWILSTLLVFIGALFLGYFLGFQQAEKELSSEREQTQKLIEQIQSIAQIDESNVTLTKRTLEEHEIERLKRELKAVLKEGAIAKTVPPKIHEAPSAQHEYAPKDITAAPPPSEKRPLRPVGAEAKLVIIIDDVSYEHDVVAIHSVGLPLVMSFLPPSPRHEDSALLASKEGSYMVHLPLEAVGYNGEEPFTLRGTDSEEKIAKRIAELKCLYPKVRYVNNHTGSKFTSDASAMEKLITVLNKQGITFVDSRTIASTKVRQVSEKFGLRYLGRDVFLDHKDGVANVKVQIKEAVEKAKKYGTAIAIGHPRPDTIQALKESRALLSEVKLVGIGEI